MSRRCQLRHVFSGPPWVIPRRGSVSAHAIKAHAFSHGLTWCARSALGDLRCSGQVRVRLHPACRFPRLTECLSTTKRRREFIADRESVDFPIFFIHFDMQKLDRRQFLRNSASAVGSVAMLAALPASIQRALAIPAHNKSGTIDDIQHIVVLMQENRSFDHYFGTLRGVRGYGDRFPIPLASGKSVWYQSDGSKEITPFRFDKNTMNAGLCRVKAGEVVFGPSKYALACRLRIPNHPQR